LNVRLHAQGGVFTWLRGEDAHASTVDDHVSKLANTGAAGVAFKGTAVMRCFTLAATEAPAGVDRPALFASTDARMALRVHDLRATFVTLALASGRSESWVTDRTGHKSSAMVAGYKRQVRTAAELSLGWLAPLDAAIPELCEGAQPETVDDVSRDCLAPMLDDSACCCGIHSRFS
jgi:hypothetical protein